MNFSQNRNIFHNHQFLVVVGRAMRAPTNGAENRNLTDYMESMGGAHILMIGGADTEILHPSLFNIQYSLFRFVVTEGSDKSEFDGFLPSDFLCG